LIGGCTDTETHKQHGDLISLLLSFQNKKSGLESEGKKPLGRHRLRWGIISKLILKKQDKGYGVDSSGSGQGIVAGSCDHGNEPSGFIKCYKFLKWLSNCWLLNKTVISRYQGVDVIRDIVHETYESVEKFKYLEPYYQINTALTNKQY
jgi:hypothetical protein